MDSNPPNTPADRPEASHLLAGAEHAAAGRTLEAENAFAAAVLAAPRLLIARFQLGLLQWTSGRPGAALVTWEPLASGAAGEPLGHFARAFAALAASDVSQAVGELEAGIATCDNAPLAADMGKLLASLAERRAPAQDQQDDAAQHVLLSNYEQVGKLH